MKKYIRNFNWLLLEKVIKIAGGLLITVWMSRYLGPHDFGVFNYSLAFIAFFSWASHLGLNQIIVRELVKCPHKSDRILGTALLMKLVGAIISMMLIAVVIVFMMQGDALVRTTVGVASLIYIFRAFDVIDFYYQAKVLSKYITIARNVAFVFSVGLQIYFIIEEYSVIYFVLAYTLEACLAGFLMLYFYIQTEEEEYSVKEWTFDRTMLTQLLKYSWPLMISVFLISIHMKVDQLMIGSMMSLDDVGVYSIAVRISESWYFIPGIIVSTVMPYFIALKESDERLYYDRLMQLFSSMFWLGVLVGLGTYFIGQDAILFLFGKGYEGAYYALLFNVWSGIFIAQGLAASILMITENLQNFRLYIQIMAVCTNVAMNAMLIPILGITGAAISTLLTHFLSTWVFGMLFKDLRPVTVMMVRASSPYHIFFRAKKEM